MCWQAWLYGPRRSAPRASPSGANSGSARIACSDHTAGALPSDTLLVTGVTDLWSRELVVRHGGQRERESRAVREERVAWAARALWFDAEMISACCQERRAMIPHKDSHFEYTATPAAVARRAQQSSPRGPVPWSPSHIEVASFDNPMKMRLTTLSSYGRIRYWAAVVVVLVPEQRARALGFINALLQQQEGPGPDRR